jgi:hypothetical protein
MIEIRQTEDDLLLGLFGHTRGLLCRRHAQHCRRLPQKPKRVGGRAHRRFSINSNPERMIAGRLLDKKAVIGPKRPAYHFVLGIRTN